MAFHGRNWRKAVETAIANADHFGVPYAVTNYYGAYHVERAEMPRHKDDRWVHPGDTIEGILHPFKKGERVQLHPGTDRWMMGDRYGEVVNPSYKGKVRVKLDKSGKSLLFNPDQLTGVE